METAELSNAKDPLCGKKTAQLLKTLHIISEGHILNSLLLAPPMLELQGHDWFYKDGTLTVWLLLFLVIVLAFLGNLLNIFEKK